MWNLLLEWKIYDINVLDFNWSLALIVFAVFLAVFGSAYFLFVWLFGRMKLGKEGVKDVKETEKQLKKKTKAERKALLKEKDGASRRLIFWDRKGKKIIVPIVSLLLVVCMIFIPVWDAVGELIIFSIGPGKKKGNADSEAARLAMGESRENVVALEKEGMVLMRNENDVLPLDVAENKKINIFGSAAFGMLYGGGGSGVFVTNAVAYGNALYATRLEKALTEEGFEYNPYLYNLVANYFDGGKKSVDDTSYDIQCQLCTYGGNTEVPGEGQVIRPTCLPENNEPTVEMYQATYSALGGKTLLQQAKEYSDVALYSIARAGSEDGDLRADQTRLTDREKAVVEMLRNNFGKVIILINSSNVLEMEELTQEGVDSILWIGHPGLTGATAVAQAISGKVNPSGKLVDTWAKKADSNPSALMTGLERQYKYSGSSTAFQIYYEGVYLGYRYYVTRAMTDQTFSYDDYVLYSFGYGLSYTTFEKHITEYQVEDGKISVQVAVTNTGEVAGKEVVELYFDAPYSGKIEKPYRELAGFAKTDVIKPGETYYARVEFDIEDMSSYSSAYKNGIGGYILEKGEYNITLRDDVWNETVSEGDTSFSYTVESDIACEKDSVTNTSVVNRFSDLEYGPNKNAVTYFSRSDWNKTYPTAEKIDLVSAVNTKVNNAVDNSDYQISGSSVTTYGAKNGLYLKDLEGKSYDDPMWDLLLDQMTFEEQCKLIDNGRMQTYAVKSLDKIETYDDDGPASVELKGVGHVSEVVLASTWNIECARLFGKSIGKEGAAIGLTGWYAPGLNMHRHATGGRNFEYYSEDPLISGLMGGYVAIGAADYGVYTYMKHFALNDQETNRQGLQVWVNEQGLREIYLRAFEIAVKTAMGNGVKAIGIMSSFTSFGTTWAGASSALLNDVLREEWGFRGVVITDWTNNSYMPVSLGLRGGNDLWLGRNGSYDAAKAYSTAPHDMSILMRRACKNILYACANSNCVWTEEQFKAVGIEGVTRYKSPYSS